MKTTFTFFFFLALSFLNTSDSKAQGCLDAALFFGAGSNSMYAFRGDDNILMDWNGNMFGAPTDIDNSFFGITGWTHIDAAFEPANGTFILISGPEIGFFDKSNNTLLGTILPMTSYYNFLPANFQEGIDAAFAWYGGGNVQHVYFFKGNEWLRIDWDHDTNGVSLGAGPEVGGFAGVLTTYFTDGVDAAIYYDDTQKVYFFSGNQYIRYDAATGVIDPGYPAVFNEPSNWGNYPSTWSCINTINNGDCNIEYHLPDNTCSESSTVKVEVSSAPGSAIGTDVKLSSVSTYIQHTWDADLTISLISPSGQEVVLSSNIGGDGDNYGISCSDPTVFDDNAAMDISSGAPPYAGTFQPLEPLSGFDDGSNPNGTWLLKMCDAEDQDMGTLQYVELSFETIVSVEAVLDDQNEISIYPNPSSGLFIIDWDRNSFENAQVIIQDLTGRAIYQNAFGPSDKMEVDLRATPKGVYLVQIQTATKIISEKITIQ